jgi:hypothetical protein
MYREFTPSLFGDIASEETYFGELTTAIYGSYIRLIRYC